MPDPAGLHIAPQFQIAPLDRDFGQSPVGRLGNRTVQQVEPGPPRTGGTHGGFFGKLKELGSRLLDAIAPPGVRTESRFRHGLEDTSKQVGELLGALSKTKDHSVDGYTARKIIDSLRQTAEPVVSRGAGYEEVLQARIGVHVRNMDMSQLLALRDGLALAKDSALRSDPEGALHLQAIEQAVTRELDQRLTDKSGTRLQQDVKETISQAPRGEKAVDYLYQPLFSKAGDLLREHGHKVNDGNKAALVKETLAGLLAGGTCNETELRALFTSLPTGELRRLVQAQPLTGSVPQEAREALQRLLDESVQDRTRQSTHGFLEGAGRLLQSKGTGDDTGSVARDIIATSRQLEQLRKHVDTHGVGTDPQVDQQLARLHEHLESLLKPSDLKLAGLGDEELQQFGKALNSLGVERGRTEVDTEIQARRAQLRQDSSEALRQALQATPAGDLPALMKALDHARKVSDAAFVREQQLTGKILGDSEDVMRFREELFGQAMEGLDEKTLGDCFGALNGTDLRVLRAGLMALGYETMGTHQELGKSVLTMRVDLGELLEHVTARLEQQGVKLPPVPDTQEYEPKDLKPEAREAIRNHFGLELGEGGRLNVKFGTVTPQFSARFEKNMGEVQDQEVRSHKEGEVDTGVDFGMWRDMLGATFTIVQPDGKSKELVDRSGGFNKLTSQQQDQRRLDGIETLVQFAGGDRQKVLEFSRFLNQNLLAGLQHAQLSEDSMVRLPDGAPGRLVGPERSVYEIRQDSEGNLVARCTHTTTGANHFMNGVTGDMTPLVPGDSHSRFSFEVTLGRDGKVTLTSPIEFGFEAKPVLDENPGVRQ